MTDEPVWAPLREELAAWSSAGRRARFWWRDDDAVRPTRALGRLLRLSRKHAVPVALAVVPAATGEALAGKLRDENTVTVLTHGWAHRNHAPEGEKKQELGAHRPPATVLAELSRGREFLARTFGARAAPVLVPPWNRIDPAVVAGLEAIGFRALSTFGPAGPAPIAVVNSTVDIMDWHGTRGCRDHAVLVGEIVDQLRLAREAAEGAPVGLLTHHLVHDASAWSFIDGLLAATAGAGDWMSMDAILAA